MDLNIKLQEISVELRETEALMPYAAVNGRWLCLVKLANLFPTVGEEHEQIASLLRRFAYQEAAAIVANEGVDRLLNLTPPLETILGDEKERLYPLPAARELARIRQRRMTDPKAALASLFEILQRIRDKREHAFKTPKGPRDSEILSAAASVLECLLKFAFEKVATMHPTASTADA